MGFKPTTFWLLVSHSFQLSGTETVGPCSSAGKSDWLYNNQKGAGSNDAKVQSHIFSFKFETV